MFWCLSNGVIYTIVWKTLVKTHEQDTIGDAYVRVYALSTRTYEAQVHVEKVVLPVQGPLRILNLSMAMPPSSFFPLMERIATWYVRDDSVDMHR